MLQVHEPQEPAAIDMVRGLVKTFSRHHGVVVLDAAIRAAVAAVAPLHSVPPAARQGPSVCLTPLVRGSAFRSKRDRGSCRTCSKSCWRRAPSWICWKAKRASGSEVDGNLEDVRARIGGLEGEEAAITARWEAQREAAQALLSARERIERGVDAEADEGEPEPLPSMEALRELEASMAALQGEVPLVFAEVNEAIVAEVVADWTGIPAGRMVTNQVAAVQALPATLANRVMGQETALQRISERVQTARAGLTDPGKPLGVFLLVGPSGVRQDRNGAGAGGSALRRRAEPDHDQYERVPGGAHRLRA